MCGIVGYIGERQSAPVLLDGLKRLEYRGYDSAGIATIDGSMIQVVRCEGRLGRLEQKLSESFITGTIGIGHTRWATHGKPSEVNAHPHRTGCVVVVHNGILENYRMLKKQCESEGRKFTSQTDTEVFAHLIDMNIESGYDFFESVRRAILEVEGSYAIAVISSKFPDMIILAKNASPLVVGLGEGENYAASDIPAILPYTKRVIVLDEKEIAVVRRDYVEIRKVSGEEVKRKPKVIQWSVIQAEKGGYKHFMLKEIYEQPRAVEDTLRGRVDFSNGPVNLEGCGLERQKLMGCSRVVFIACGTSYHASVYGKYLVERVVGIPSVCEVASEFRNRDPVVGKEDLVVAISQSGETIDTLEALKIAKSKGAAILSVVNVVDSAIPRASDMVIYTHAGPEIGVASTKCFTAQLAAIVLLSCGLAMVKGGERQLLKAREIVKVAVKIPKMLNSILSDSGYLKEMARKYSFASNFLYIGRGFGFPVAMEGALKLKEISYIHAEAYAAGEMKHGPIALIDRMMPVVVIVPHDEQYCKVKGNLEEVKAREGVTIAVVTEGKFEEIRNLCDEIITLPDVPTELMPFCAVIPLQLFAYYVADFKGTDVDQPRNLAKTVTVE